MYKEKDGFCFQLDYGDISRVWFLNICKKGDENIISRHIVREQFKTKAQGLERFKYFYDNPNLLKQEVTI